MSQALDIAFVIGRILVGLFFLMSGFKHFKHVKMMSGYSKSKGVPAPGAAVMATGAMLILGGASILLGYHPTIGVALLAVFLLGASFGMHTFWKLQDPMAKMNDMIHFQKNMAMLGALLMTLAIPRPWPMSLGR